MLVHRIRLSAFYWIVLSKVSKACHHVLYMVYSDIEISRQL